MNRFWDPDPQKSWERDVRDWWGWWLFSLLPFATIVLASKYVGSALFPYGWLILLGPYLFGVFIAFNAGFFYNDRMRQLGRQRGFIPKLRRPPSELPKD